MGLLWGFGLCGACFYRLVPWGFCAFCCGGKLLTLSVLKKFFTFVRTVDSEGGNVVGLRCEWWNGRGAEILVGSIAKDTGSRLRWGGHETIVRRCASPTAHIVENPALVGNCKR